MEWYGYVLLVAGLLIVAFIFFLIGMLYRKKVAEREIGSAETEATRIINEAIKGGENKKREMLVEAKEEIHKSRTEYEKEVKERRNEVQRLERAGLVTVKKWVVPDSDVELVAYPIGYDNQGAIYAVDEEGDTILKPEETKTFAIRFGMSDGLVRQERRARFIKSDFYFDMALYPVHKAIIIHGAEKV